MQNRSREELEGILQTFPDVFESQMGTKLTVERLTEILTKKLKEQEQKLLDQRFFDFDPKSIRMMLQIIQESVEKPVEKPKRGRPKRD